MIAVHVNGRPVAAQAIVSHGHLLLPMRRVFEALGATVQYEGRIVVARNRSHRVVLPIGMRDAVVDGRTVALETPARIILGTTYVPLRFAAQALGARVSYDAPARLVAITTLASNASTADEGDVVLGPQTISAEQPANDRVAYSFYTTGDTGNGYRYGDWMHFVLIAPPGGSASIALCNLGIVDGMSPEGQNSTHYEADIPAPPGYWIPFCPVTATYVSWSGITTVVPIPLAIALYTRANNGYETPYYGGPYYGEPYYGGGYYGAPYYTQPAPPPTPVPRSLLPNEPRAVGPTRPPMNSVRPLRPVRKPIREDRPTRSAPAQNTTPEKHSTTSTSSQERERPENPRERPQPHPTG